MLERREQHKLETLQRELEVNELLQSEVNFC